MENPNQITGLTIQFRVADYQQGVHWYSNFLGRTADFLPHEGFEGQVGFAEWELIPGSNCWLQVAEGEPTPGSGPLRIGVKNIERALDRIRELLGADNPQIGETPDKKVRYCTFEDPFGNRVGFFEEA